MSCVQHICIFCVLVAALKEIEDASTGYTHFGNILLSLCVNGSRFPDIYERFSPTYFISILVFFAFRTDFRSSYIMNSTIAGIEVSGERSVFNLASKVIRNCMSIFFAL